MSSGNRIPTDGGPPLRQNPFAGLPAVDSGDRIADAGKSESSRGGAGAQGAIRYPVSEIGKPKSRGRVDITRQTAGRGGKTVTVVSGFLGIGQTEKEQLAKKMQKACGTGGTVKEGRIEIQGDKREQVAQILAAAGFRPVFAGG